MSETSDRIAELEAILNAAVDAIITIDVRGTIVSANPATVKMFQYSTTELIGQNVKLLMPSPYREQHDEYLTRYLETGIAKIIGFGREVVGRRKDGTIFPMHIAVSDVRLKSHRLFTGIVRDVSDLKAAEEKLARLNRELEQRIHQRTAELRRAQAELVAQERLAMLGKISGGIAHEIRNPLSAVRTSAYFLLNAKNVSPEKTLEHLQRIDRQVTLIDNVITALTDIARMPDPVPQRIRLEDLLPRISHEQPSPDRWPLRLELAHDLRHILADEHQLTIVFRNLLANARDAMPDGGEITIRAVNKDDRVLVSIQDRGAGIPQEDLPRIMEPLFSTKARGMGLGLAISRTIATKNGCELKVDSKLGQGSTFTVELQSDQGPRPNAGVSQ
jgi:two-component system sensor kinase FixL